MPTVRGQTETGHARQPPEYLAVGRVVRPHGIRGALKVSAGSDLWPSIKASSKVYIGEAHTEAIVVENRPYRADYLLILEGCSDRNQAEALRGEEIFLRFEETEPLPEGVYYQWQIIGLVAETEQGRSLGVVEQILETGANDVYLVRTPSGDEILLPAVEHVIRKVDIAEGRMVVSLLPGLADESGV